MSITRLSGGLTPGDGSDPRTFPEIFNDVADLVEAAGSDIDTLEGKNIPAFGTATPSDGQVLTFDSAGSVFVPEDVAGSLEDLTDTSISSPVSGEVLEYDGTNWVNAAAAVGGILQVVSTTKTDTFTTSSQSYTTITGLTATITPSSASSKVFIIVQIGSLSASDNNSAMIRLSGGNTSGYIGDSDGNRVSSVTGSGRLDVNAAGDAMQIPASITFLDSPATTSSTSYGVEIRVGNSGTAAVNRSELDPDVPTVHRSASSITVMEVAV